MKIYYLFIFLFLFSFFSCDKVDGEGIPPKFDTEPHIFSKNAVDTTIISKNDVNWTFAQIFVNNKEIGNDDETITYHRLKPSPNADDQLGHIYKFENDWFSIEKIDNKNIKIILKENKTELNRTLNFDAFAGNASTKISIAQMAVQDDVEN